MQQLDLFGSTRVTGTVRAMLPEPPSRVHGPCRVRACASYAGASGLCPEHDTPQVRSMSRPHRYVFDGRRVVLESAPWESVAGLVIAVDDDSCAVVHLVHELAEAAAGMPQRVDENAPSELRLVQCAPAPARPCWDFCGRSGPARGCHPGSRYSQAPAAPCLACARPFLPCRAAPGSVLTCSEPCRDLWAAVQSGDDAMVEAFAHAHLAEDELERWQERAAIMHADRPRGGAGRALADLWPKVAQA
jgi:hypothetical protein